MEARRNFILLLSFVVVLHAKRKSPEGKPLSSGANFGTSGLARFAKRQPRFSNLESGY
jgi:hypothetical protein